MKYQVEIVWNREFNWVQYGNTVTDLDVAIKQAKALENMGDGAVVKKARVVDEDDKVVFAYGKKIK